jgi:hypothetical protein
VIDAKCQSNGNEPFLNDLYTSRNGYWYLILTVTDSDLKDCLQPNYPKREEIVSHLKSLRNEYFTTSNYMEAYLKMK